MSDVRFFDLTIPARRRLAMMREAFATHAKRYPHCPEHAKPADWRAVRGWRLNSWEWAFGTLDQGRNDDSPVWYCHTGSYFRGERDADDIVSSLPSGWYTDTECSDTAIGIVGRLPHGRFVAGYRWTSNDERVYYPEVFDDEREAARRADSHAERFAESSREDSERFDAMQDAETDAEHAEREFRRSFALRHHPAGGMDEAREALQALREARETLQETTQAYERG